MKRLIIRISALAGVLAIGYIAVAQARRGDDQSSITIEPTSNVVIVDQDPEEQNKANRALNEQLPPRPRAINPISVKPLPVKVVAPKTVTQLQAPQPLRASSVSEPNPLRENDLREKPAGVSSHSSIQLAQANGQLSDRSDLPPSSTALSATAPRPLTSNQVAAAPLEKTNLAPRNALSTIPDRHETANTRPLSQAPQTASDSKPMPNSHYPSNSSGIALPPPAYSSAGGLQKPTPLQNSLPQPTLPTTARDTRTDTLANGPGISAEGTGTPARDRKLDGSQSPQLTIEKIAPQEIQVGNAATFRVVVRNTGTITAREVEIRDQVPKGTRLEATNPRASRDVRGELVWNLGDMEPGEEKTVEAKLMPISEGEIGSVATVHFKANASVRTRATKPELVVQTSAPKSVTIGEEVKLTITVSNPGSGVARGVVIQEQVPAGLQHPAGDELEYEIGDLAPNQSRTLELKLSAARPGQVTNVLVARAEAGLKTIEKLPLEVIAPQLKLAISGPKRRFLERKTTYKLSVSNPGTAPARDVKLQAKLPDGMRFVSANNNGHYDSQSKVVSWALAELPVNETGNVLLTAMPEEIGEQKLTYRGTAEGALSVEEQKEIVVDGISAIRFEVVDVEDPVEVGGETLYEIRVINQGTKDSSNIRLEVTLPPSMQLVTAEGPGDIRSNAVGNHVSFDPLRRLSPKVDATYRVRVRCGQAGDQRIRVQLQTNDMQSPVTKEESTRVFSDN